MYMHNFKTGQMEYRDQFPSAEDVKQFIPQIPGALGLYQVYLAMGKEYKKAFAEVLTKCLGE